MTTSWTNWSNSVRCAPRLLSMPQSETAIVDLVRQAQQSHTSIRVAGTGHSFVPLCASEDMLLSLDHLQGVIAPARSDKLPATPAGSTSEERSATIWAGTKLYQLGDPLWARGLALTNMGDIDRQSLAGALSTGTHGTGRTLGSLSTQVIGLRLVTATGEILACSSTVEPEIFKAAQVSLGALGIITQVTLRLSPAYQLHERTWVAAVEECLATFESLSETNRHFEFFWVPSQDVCAMKALNPIRENDPPPVLQRVEMQANGEMVKNGSPLRGRLLRYIGDDRIDRSYRIFPAERNIKFNETEFALPAAHGPACLRELRQLMQTKYSDIIWPLEYRTLAADEIDLSPAYGRATVTISVHQAAELPYQPFFADAEAIFRNHQGRPHWGKIHTYRAPDLQKCYPQWAHFQQIRQRLDPTGLWLNAYLRTLFD